MCFFEARRLYKWWWHEPCNPEWINMTNQLQFWNPRSLCFRLSSDGTAFRAAAGDLHPVKFNSLDELPNPGNGFTYPRIPSAGTFESMSFRTSQTCWDMDSFRGGVHFEDFFSPASPPFAEERCHHLPLRGNPWCRLKASAPFQSFNSFAAGAFGHINGGGVGAVDLEILVDSRIPIVKHQRLPETSHIN